MPHVVQWGIDNEERAWRDYIKLMRKVTDVSTQPLGLTGLPSCSYIGASGDGKIHDKSMPECCQEGVLEIKFPYSINSEVITSEEVHEIELDFMVMHQGRATLNSKHKYYAQVQGEMAVLGLTWCDFVIWTAAAESNIYIERIEFDPDFVSKMLPKLQEFYGKHSVPYLKAVEQEVHGPEHN